MQLPHTVISNSEKLTHPIGQVSLFRFYGLTNYNIWDPLFFKQLYSSSYMATVFSFLLYSSVKVYRVIMRIIIFFPCGISLFALTAGPQFTWNACNNGATTMLTKTIINHYIATYPIFPLIATSFIDSHREYHLPNRKKTLAFIQKPIINYTMQTVIWSFIFRIK